MPRTVKRAFTLVEILIVVVILGILAAIVAPQFSDATTKTAETATLDQLVKVRRAIGVFQARNRNTVPQVQEGDGTWGELVSTGVDGTHDYFFGPPVNAWVGGSSARQIRFGNAPDNAYQTNYGWIFDPSTGNVWAGGFDFDDHPFPRS